MSDLQEHIANVQDDPSHIKGKAMQQARKGCVTKCIGSELKNHHGSFRRNGYLEHQAHPVKSARYEPQPDRVRKYPPQPEQQVGMAKGVKRKPRLPRGAKGRWIFTGKNFKNANIPFPHAYHHMVPWEVMSETFADMSQGDVAELILFQRATYNINEGVNLIILPCSKRIGLLLQLYSHPNDHPDYSQQLIDQLNALKGVIKGDPAKAHLKPKEIKGLKDMLVAWETAEWMVIAEGGKRARGAHVNRHVSSDVASVFAALGAGA